MKSKRKIGVEQIFDNYLLFILFEPVNLMNIRYIFTTLVSSSSRAGSPGSGELATANHRTSDTPGHPSPGQTGCHIVSSSHYKSAQLSWTDLMEIWFQELCIYFFFPFGTVLFLKNTIIVNNAILLRCVYKKLMQ